MLFSDSMKTMSEVDNYIQFPVLKQLKRLIGSVLEWVKHQFDSILRDTSGQNCYFELICSKENEIWGNPDVSQSSVNCHCC